MLPKVSVVILNYNGKDWLEKFLPNVIEHNTYTNAEIIIADNASTDDSVTFIHKYYPDIRLIQNPTNNGYAGGYNDALKQIQSDYYVLLNSDVEVTPGWIENMMDFMQQDSLMAACQPKILSYNDRELFEYAGAAGGFIDKYGYPFCRGRIFDTCEKDKGQYDQNCEIFWASGACLFIRADLYHSTGGLDEDFFAHMEEIDLCWRLKNLGYKIGYCAESVVYHVGGGTLHKSNPRKTFLNFRNNRSLLHKNLSEQSLQHINFIRNILDWITWLKTLLRESRVEADAIKNALKDYKASKKLLEDKRHANEEMEKSMSIGSQNTSGVYNGSIVWSYFICRIKAFSKIPVSKFSNYTK